MNVPGVTTRQASTTCRGEERKRWRHDSDHGRNLLALLWPNQESPTHFSLRINFNFEKWPDLHEMRHTLLTSTYDSALLRSISFCSLCILPIAVPPAYTWKLGGHASHRNTRTHTPWLLRPPQLSGTPTENYCSHWLSNWQDHESFKIHIS